MSHGQTSFHGNKSITQVSEMASGGIARCQQSSGKFKVTIASGSH
jgi:hypothetical protein